MENDLNVEPDWPANRSGLESNLHRKAFVIENETGDVVFDENTSYKHCRSLLLLWTVNNIHTALDTDIDFPWSIIDKETNKPFNPDGSLPPD